MVIIENQIQGTAAKVVLTFAALGAVSTTVKLHNQWIKFKKNANRITCR